MTFEELRDKLTRLTGAVRVKATITPDMDVTVADVGSLSPADSKRWSCWLAAKIGRAHV